MGNGSRIRPTRPEPQSRFINPTRPREEGRRLSFSFKCLQEKGDKFKYSEQETEFFNRLIERLRDLSRMTWGELKVIRSDALRCHPIDFRDKGVSEDTFGLPAEDVDESAWQFQLSKSTGRVHGFITADEVFHVVWLDPKHELYS